MRGRPRFFVTEADDALRLPALAAVVRGDRGAEGPVEGTRLVARFMLRLEGAAETAREGAANPASERAADAARLLARVVRGDAVEPAGLLVRFFIGDGAVLTSPSSSLSRLRLFLV